MSKNAKKKVSELYVECQLLNQKQRIEKTRSQLICIIERMASPTSDTFESRLNI